VIEDELAAIAEQGLYRHRRLVDSPCGPRMMVDGRSVLAFASNDYLGFANDQRLIEATVDAVRRWGVGAGASHYLGGHFRPHDDLEHRLAQFLGLDAASLFSTGYMANLAAVTVMVGRGDAVFADRLNHASLIDAVRLSGADSHRYRHGDVAGLEHLLVKAKASTRLIVTDGVFSMDGDIAPLADLLAVAERHDAWLLVDDAHAFGVLGPKGRGTAALFGLSSPRLLVVGTLGKAAGVAGAFVAGSELASRWLRQKARTSIFTTASPPMLACALIESLRLIEDADDRRQHLTDLIRRFRQAATPLCANRGWRLSPSETAIQPLIVGDNKESVALSDALLARGIWAPAIRPPTVPAGQARLRISLSAAHSVDDVDQLIEALLAIRT
jgi:8-amino-7-oxononanoate synthase